MKANQKKNLSVHLKQTAFWEVNSNTSIPTSENNKKNLKKNTAISKCLAIKV